MKRFSRFLMIPGLVAVSCLLSLGVLALAYLAVDHFGADEFGEFLHEWGWSTLVAGFLALLGAWATIRAIRDQMAQAEQHADEVRTRKSKAARSSMPFALVSIAEYATDCVRYAIALSDQRGKASEDGPIELPKEPSHAIPVLRDCIEHASSGLDEAIARMLSSLQLVQSRMQSTHKALYSPCQMSSPRSHGEAADRLVDASELRARVDKLFDYARQITEDAPTPLALKDVENAFGVMTRTDGPSTALLRTFRSRLMERYQDEPKPEHW